MNVIDDLLASLQTLPDRPVKRVLVGLYWTAVQGSALGLAATQADATCCEAHDIAGVGRLHEQSTHTLAALARSDQPVEAGIGLAAINSSMQVNALTGIELNARDLLLDRARGRRVALIGHFPFADELRRVASALWILELNPGPGDLPAAAAPEWIPQADVVGLTASTLSNGTFDGLSKLFPPRALVVMMGPSTPLSPVLFEHGVQILAGAIVDDPATVIHYVEQATSLHRIPGLRRVTLSRSPNPD